ncbi:MAG: hypothetical protein HC911_09015 [Chloroflexaceae bacterium]|nr:hypothetical protein [Chloroflexaceae bacterium]
MLCIVQLGLGWRGSPVPARIIRDFARRRVQLLPNQGCGGLIFVQFVT